MATATGPTLGDRLNRLVEVFAVSLVAGVAAAVAGGFVAVATGFDGASLLPFVGTYVFVYAALGATALVYALRYGGLDFLDLTPPSLRDVRDALLALLGVVVAVLSVAGVAALAGFPVAHPAAVGEPVAASLLLAAVPLSLVLGVPAQELLLRNVCQKRLDERFPAWVAVGGPSLLMVALTLAPFAGAPAVGLVVPALAVAVASNAVGLVYHRSGTLVSAWLLHAALTVTLLSVLYLDATTAFELNALF